MNTDSPTTEHADSAAVSPAIKGPIIRGLGWTAAGRAIHEAISFVVGVILARLLTPETYGLLAMVQVFLYFARLFSDLGMTGAVIQRREIESRQLSTLFWVNIAAGGLIALIFALCAPLIAAFYHEPRLVPITLAIAFIFAVGTFNDLQTALLRRSMQFRRQALIDTFATLIAGIVAIGMAVGGYGVWSLVAQLFAATLMSVGIMWFTTPWKPRLYFNLAEVRDILNFSASLQGFKVAGYFAGNIDNMLVGRFLDAVTLGNYGMAYKYMLMPGNLLTQVLHPVLLPAFSRIQDEHGRLAQNYMKMVKIMAFASMPLAVGLFVTADTLILALPGSRWVTAIPLLRILAVGAAALPLFHARHWLIMALGRGDVLLRWQIVDAVLSLALFFIGVQFGAAGVAAAFVVRTYALLYPLLASAGRLIGLPFRVYARQVVPNLLVSLAMGGLVWGVTAVALGGLPVGLTFAIQVALGGLAYVGLALALRLEALQEIIRLLRGLLSGASMAAPGVE